MASRVRVPTVFKNVIAPVQAWLLSQGRCVGCGRELAAGKKQKRKDQSKQVTCQCGRIFIYDPKVKRYRRALITEV